MKIASIKVVEVPDGDSCKYPPATPITRSNYCEHFSLTLWNKPQKKKIRICKLFNEYLKESAEEPLKCDRCRRSEVPENTDKRQVMSERAYIEYIEKLVDKHSEILELLCDKYPNADWEKLLTVAALLMIADGLDKLHDNL